MATLTELHMENSTLTSKFDLKATVKDAIILELALDSHLTSNRSNQKEKATKGPTGTTPLN